MEDKTTDENNNIRTVKFDRPRIFLTKIDFARLPFSQSLCLFTPLTRLRKLVETNSFKIQEKIYRREFKGTINRRN